MAAHPGDIRKGTTSVGYVPKDYFRSFVHMDAADEYKSSPLDSDVVDDVLCISLWRHA